VPAFLTEIEVEARNAEHKVGSVVTDMAAVNLFYGTLTIQCSADGECDGQCDEDCHWLVGPGEDIIIEVYDRATTSVWFTLTDEDSRALASMFRFAAT
jgi:hypothetical protein